MDKTKTFRSRPSDQDLQIKTMTSRPSDQDLQIKTRPSDQDKTKKKRCNNPAHVPGYFCPDCTTDPDTPFILTLKQLESEVITAAYKAQIDCLPHIPLLGVSILEALMVSCAHCHFPHLLRPRAVATMRSFMQEKKRILPLWVCSNEAYPVADDAYYLCFNCFVRYDQAYISETEVDSDTDEAPSKEDSDEFTPTAPSKCARRTTTADTRARKKIRF